MDTFLTLFIINSKLIEINNGKFIRNMVIQKHKIVIMRILMEKSIIINMKNISNRKKFKI